MTYTVDEIRSLINEQLNELSNSAETLQNRARTALNGRNPFQAFFESFREIIENCVRRVGDAFSKIFEEISKIVEEIRPYVSMGNPQELLRTAQSWDSLTRILQTLAQRLSPEYFKAHQSWSGGVADNYRALISSQSAAVGGVSEKPVNFAEFLTKHALGLQDMWVSALEMVISVVIDFQKAAANIVSNAAPWDWANALGPIADFVASAERTLTQALAEKLRAINEYYRNWRSVQSSLVDSTGLMDGAWPTATLAE